MKFTIFFTLLLFVACSSNNKKTTQLLTVAEKSDYQSTSTYADVISFIETLKQQHPEMRVELITILSKRMRELTDSSTRQ